MLPLVFVAHDAIPVDASPIVEAASTDFSERLAQEVPDQEQFSSVITLHQEQLSSEIAPQEPTVTFSPRANSFSSRQEHPGLDDTVGELFDNQAAGTLSSPVQKSEDIHLQEIRQLEQVVEQSHRTNSAQIESLATHSQVSPRFSRSENVSVEAMQVQDIAVGSQQLSTLSDENLSLSVGEADETLTIDSVQILSQTLGQESETSDLDEAQLFEQVFGQPNSDIASQIEVPLVLNGASYGTVLVYPHSEVAHVTMAANTFLSLAHDSLNETVQSNLQSAITSDGQLSLAVLQAEGIDANFDRRRLRLYVDVPPNLRLTAINSIDESSRPPSESDLTLPGQLSGYLNLRGTQTLDWASEQSKLKPLGLQFNGAVNWQGWVLEANGQATLGQSWQLGQLSVVRDAPTQAIRYTIGDLSVPTVGYQAGPPLFGLSVARNFSLQPFRVARPTSNYSFFLERTSTVDVFINDELTSTLRLEAGPQDIRDLPLKTGINEIRLEIKDDLGQTETLEFSTGVAGELLAEGVHQFAYNIGVPTIARQPLKSYDFARPTLSLFHRVGLTSNLTLGGYLQGDFTQQMVGIDGTWATTVGNIGWDMAASNHADYSVDMAAKLFYEWIEPSSESSQNRQLRAALEYRGENFSVLGEDSPQNSTALNLSVAYQQVLFENIQARLNGQYQLNREGSNAYGIGINLSRPLGQGMNINVGYQYGQSSSHEINQRFSVGLSGTLPFAGQRFNTRTELNNTLEPSNSLTWSYSPNHTLGTVAPSLTLIQSPTNYGLNGRLQYQGHRSMFGLNHEVTLPRETNDSIANSSTITWGTAIAFVDGVWGWSRPIDNSFVLVTRQGSAEGEIVRVNPTSSGDMAQANGSGPAVLSVAPYSLNQLSLDAPDLKLGQDLGQTSHQLLPSYRSGTLIRTGTEATVLMRGVLVNEKQEPLILQQGWIESLSDSSWPTVEFFTNRTGRFVAAGLKPGLYRLHLSENDLDFLEFEILEQQQGIFNIGTLQLSEAK